MVTIPIRGVAENVPWLPRLRRALGQLFEAFVARRQRARERDALMSMDERLLKDIGLSRADAHFAAHRLEAWQRDASRMPAVILETRS